MGDIKAAHILHAFLIGLGAGMVGYILYTSLLAPLEAKIGITATTSSSTSNTVQAA